MNAAGPVSDKDRILALDALRGLAVLGILVMNIQDFSQIMEAYSNPTATGPLSGANYWFWLAAHLTAEEKFMAIFSMLYGAGIVLFTGRVEARGGRVLAMFGRRSLWLLVFGLAHAYLLWSGDILVSYAVIGMAVYPFRKWETRRLLAAGALVLAIGSGLSLMTGWSMQFWGDEAVKDMEQGMWKPPAERVERETEAHREGWLAEMPWRAADSFSSETQVLAIFTLWRAGGLMLLGMGLYKSGFLTGSLEDGFYGKTAAIGLAAGVPLILWGVHRNFAAGWDLRYSLFTGSQFNYWGSLGVSAAWMSAMMLLSRRAPAIARRFAAIGRMAFSNYMLETLICTTIFEGYGLNLFAKVNRAQEMAVTVGVWAVIYVVSQVWMKRFYFGPLEWLWRSLTYGEKEPMVRKNRALRAA